MSPTVFGDISYQAIQTTGGGGSSSGMGAGSSLTVDTTVGDFGVQIQSKRTDPDPSTLSTTTIDIRNKTAGTQTLKIIVSSKDFTTGFKGTDLMLTCTIQGSSSNANKNQLASGQTWIDSSNSLFNEPSDGTAGVLIGKAAGNGNTIYSFDKGGICDPVTVTSDGKFSITQVIFITLAAGKQAQITLSSSVEGVATPEPSTMAIAGLGVLGMIGYGLRRRRGA